MPSRLRLWLLSSTLVTLSVALWLLWVTRTVLPMRDPAHIPLWRTVAVCMVTFAGVCAAFMAQGPNVTWLRWSVLVLSVAAIGAGLYGIVAMLQRAHTSGHFEGYVLLMGLILTVHGLAAIAYARSLTTSTTSPAASVRSV